MNAEAEDCELARRAAQGDQGAFGDLVRRHQAIIFNLAYRLLGEREEAEDVTQEAFLRAWRALLFYDPQRPFAPWLKKIAINLCLNRLKRREAWFLEDWKEIPQTITPEMQTLERENQSELWEAVFSLPPRYRVVLELRHFEDMTYADIAQTLHCPPNTVKSMLFRARRMLMARIQKFSRGTS